MFDLQKVLAAIKKEQGFSICLQPPGLDNQIL